MARFRGSGDIGKDLEDILDLDEKFAWRRRRSSWYSRLRSPRIVVFLLLLIVVGIYVVNRGASDALSRHKSCDTVNSGYQCQNEISHHWGQYSPYFRVDGDISDDIPGECHITFAQVLSRHGARHPTAYKTVAYDAVVRKIHENVKSFRGDYAFLAKYRYTLGADDLTTFGQQQLVNSGIKFYNRYKSLARENNPFVRAASQERVVDSAVNFTQGFHEANLADRHSGEPNEYPMPILSIIECSECNNTLDHGICDKFESGPLKAIGSTAMKTWAKEFVPPIQSRLNIDLPGANLSIAETLNFMELCPFEVVAHPKGEISKFCHLFTEKEWHQYSYLQSVSKYYGYEWGNPLGATQGVGFANELIARMTGQPVHDHTSVNHTLDDNPQTFPIPGRDDDEDRQYTLFADFTHDNDLATMYAALGLYNATEPLSNTTLQSPTETKGWSSAWTIPFAARVYFEKMKCEGIDEELVRVIVNDRVIPLQNCDADKLGRCTLDKWVESLSFARSGGHWNQCFD